MPPAPSRLVAALEALTRAHPVERKLLVASDVNFGREVLLALARRTGGWIGWEATNLRGIAESLAFLPLHERGLRAGRDVEIGAAVNRAMRQVIDARRVSSRFASLADSAGFRRAVLDTVLEVRTAGVTAAEIRRCARRDSPAADLPPVLDAYESLLAAERLVDPAGLFHLAVERFDDEAPYTLNGRIFLVPALSAVGLPGALLAKLRERAAEVLDADAPRGLSTPPHVIGHTVAPGATPDDAGHTALAWLPSPTLPATNEPGLRTALLHADLFCAATPADEIREVCRRVIEEGLRWDDVEIAATDPDTYGVALDALCQQLGIGATMLQGVPLARTRIGRALGRWLTWLEEGLPADILRQALEAGDVNAPGRDAAGQPADLEGGARTSDAAAGALPATALGRELRRLRIGWGRARYDSALARLQSGDVLAHVTIRDDESDDEFAVRRAGRAETIDALTGFLSALLEITPVVPERGSLQTVHVTSAELARATLGYLELVTAHGAPEQQTLSRLRARLVLLSEVDAEREAFGRALAELREALADLRAWPLMTSERKPWSAGGGMLHLTDVTHGGTTGRPRVFVVGLDAERTAGVGRQHPLLPDSARRAIGGDRLTTSEEKRRERAYRMTASLAALRGRVTLSYATSASLDGRESGPSPLLLQAWRILKHEPGATYERFRKQLGAPRCAVPTRDVSGAGAALLDARDVWLDAIAEGSLLLDATSVVRESFPMLAVGLDAVAMAEAGELSPYHGLVPDAGPALDPANFPDREISPSSLERLAACPLAWFYRHGLHMRPPDDPEYDEDEWLDTAQRGSLLHEVYEAFARAYRGRQDELGTPTARALVLSLVNDAISRYREEVPPPGETVFARQAAELRESAIAFLQMEKERFASGDRAEWRHFEYAFGSGNAAGRYALSDGRTLAIRGRADRVDLLPDGTFRVIDYKTGRATQFRRNPRAGPFHGGRHLQPALYAGAVEGLTQTKVSRFEYRFPTDRGGNAIVLYTAADLEGTRSIITTLLEHVQLGHFVPTTDPADCRYCDYAGLCRGSTDGWKLTTARATWAATHAEGLPEYRSMLARRGKAVPEEVP